MHDLLDSWSGIRRPAGAHADPGQAFRYYIDAFLNAAYSCQEILRAEAVPKLMSRPAFDRWESRWTAVDDQQLRSRFDWLRGGGPATTSAIW
jgi:hypothetical protein